jgi:hypothetical protein
MGEKAYIKYHEKGKSGESMTNANSYNLALENEAQEQFISPITYIY